jgi:hypothetical protein
VQQPSVYLDVIARFVSFGAHFRDGLAIDRNHSGGNEFLGVPSGGDSRTSDNFMESFQHRVRRKIELTD